ncbi:hypothetical protein [Microbacterium sp.]|uniref:hypothetical protein n=1 Tax=Microbacterium sp. TaxID=51671 RepID=UPI003BB1C28D
MRLADGIRRGLEAEGMSVDVVHAGTDGLRMAGERDYDAIMRYDDGREFEAALGDDLSVVTTDPDD